MWTNSRKYAEMEENESVNSEVLAQGEWPVFARNFSNLLSSRLTVLEFQNVNVNHSNFLTTRMISSKQILILFATIGIHFFPVPPGTGVTAFIFGALTVDLIIADSIKTYGCFFHLEL